jgi:hypothetical protein
MAAALRIHKGLIFRSPDVKVAGVEEHQALHEREKSNLSFLSSWRERALLRAHFHLEVFSVVLAIFGLMLKSADFV